MRIALAVLMLIAGVAFAEPKRPPDPREPRAKAAAVEYRSAFAGYRAYADPQQRDWRKSNQEVGNAAGQGGHP
jgi:hypothetical protein